MAVNNADITALQRRMNELRNDMQNMSAEINKTSQHIINDTQKKLDALNHLWHNSKSKNN